MKLNNKGFAITGILYTVFVLFLLILLSVLSGLNIKRKTLEKNIKNINEQLEESCETMAESAIGYTTKYQGKYTIVINGAEYITYLPKGKQLTQTELEDLTYIGISINPTGFSSATITEICTTEKME